MTLTGNFFVALFVSLLVVPLCRKLAFSAGYVAKPSDERWHSETTAIFGGVAIFVTVLSCSVLLGLSGLPVVLIVAASGMFVLGLIDDIWSLKPFTKLIVQIVIAATLLFYEYRLEWTGSLIIDTLLTLGWIVGISNAFNLLDNMDGLCAGVSVIVGLTVLFTLLGQPDTGTEINFLVILLGATLGFLVYNVSPASIFLGDSGSLFLGVCFAVLTLQSGYLAGGGQSNILSIVAAPVLVLLVPIADTTLVSVMRILHGRRPSEGGRDHSSHRLVAIGLSERAAVGVLWGLAALGGLAGLGMQWLSGDWSSVLAVVVVLAIAIFGIYLAQVRVYEGTESERKEFTTLRPLTVNLAYKRQVAEVILDVFLISLAYYAAYRVRFEGVELAALYPSFLESLPLVLAIQVIILLVTGAYRVVWRHFGLMDAVTLGKGVMLGTLTSVFVLVFVYRFENYSRGVFIIYGALLILMLAGSRASFRIISESIRRGVQTGDRLVIYGAGDGGVAAMRELLNQNDCPYQMLGFVDDDTSKLRTWIHGYPILGDYNGLVSLLMSDAIDCVVLGTRMIDSGRLSDLEKLCAEHNVKLSRMHVDFKSLVAVS